MANLRIDDDAATFSAGCVGCVSMLLAAAVVLGLVVRLFLWVAGV